jgi:hypothetical protein
MDVDETDESLAVPSHVDDFGIEVDFDELTDEERGVPVIFNAFLSPISHLEMPGRNGRYYCQVGS